MSHWNGLLPDAGPTRRSSKGFTVIEFLVALTLVGISISMALPMLRQFSINNQLVSANNTIVTGLNLARSTAISTGDDITICPSADGASCAQDSWDKGWIVFNDADNDGAVDADEILRVITIESEVDNSGFGDQIVFQADGTTSMGSNATITNCSAHGEVAETCADVTVNQFGLIDSEKRQAESATPPAQDPS